jgi:cardiolipin synthase
MFIEMWNFSDLRTDDTAKLYFENRYPEKTEASGYVVPYADSPIDNDPMGENVYINILGNSVDYCWFMSPYLVLSDELKRAISLAAKRGVDVRIITPGIPDKRTVFGVTRSYYNLLAKSGARIYEFTPGFNHCKLCLSDDDTCVVGTINLDYRSLFHHFENGVLLYKVDAIADVKKDFLNTFEVSEEVTEKAKQKPNLFMRFIRSLLRLIAPLL